jgi:peptidoglycan/LPS O-acetylase OafA/YrhL
MQTVPGHRIRSLDSLRGIAAVIVVVQHIMLCLPDASRENLRYINLPLLLGGRFAVMLFFVLSGFVLALPYFAGTSAAYGPYLVRRFCRLYPPFAFAVLVSALLCYLFGGVSLPGLSDWLTEAWGSPVTSGALASHLVMTGIHRSSIRLDGPIWSLIIEMRISIIFPLLVLYVRRFGWLGVGASLVAAFACSKTAKYALGETSSQVAERLIGAFLLTTRYMAFFLLGAVTAARLDRIKDTFVRVSTKIHAAVFVVMVFIWMALAYIKEVGPHQGYVDVFCGVFTMYLIVACVAFPKVAAMLSGRVCLWLGDISYSLYLIHLPVLLAVFYLLYGRMSLGAIIVVAFPAMLLAGHVMHYLIERPSMKLGRKLAGAIG